MCPGPLAPMDYGYRSHGLWSLSWESQPSSNMAKFEFPQYLVAGRAALIFSEPDGRILDQHNTESAHIILFRLLPSCGGGRPCPFAVSTKLGWLVHEISLVKMRYFFPHPIKHHLAISHPDLCRFFIRISQLLESLLHRAKSS